LVSCVVEPVLPVPMFVKLSSIKYIFDLTLSVLVFPTSTRIMNTTVMTSRNEVISDQHNRVRVALLIWALLGCASSTVRVRSVSIDWLRPLTAFAPLSLFLRPNMVDVIERTVDVNTVGSKIVRLSLAEWGVSWSIEKDRKKRRKG